MANFQAPVSLDMPAPGKGTTVQMPWSGAVNQSILPWRWAFDWIGNQFSVFTINLGRSSAPEVETEILNDVGSYGRQLGRLSEAVEVLVRRLPPRRTDRRGNRRDRSVLGADARDRQDQGAGGTQHGSTAALLMIARRDYFAGRVKSCGLLAPDLFRSCGLLRLERSWELLGFAVGGWPTVALFDGAGALGFVTPPVLGVMPPVLGVV